MRHISNHVFPITDWELQNHEWKKIILLGVKAGRIGREMFETYIVQSVMESNER